MPMDVERKLSMAGTDNRMNSIASPAAFESLPGKGRLLRPYCRFAAQWRYRGVFRTSAFAACLFPILEAFGKAGIARQLLEAVPHFARQAGPHRPEISW